MRLRNSIIIIIIIIAFFSKQTFQLLHARTQAREKRAARKLIQFIYLLHTL